jgi:hypothetical protein
MLVATANYFTMLGVTPQIGRLSDSRDDVPGFALVTVLSDDLWRRSYGSDPHVLGRTLRMDNAPYTIIGVLPPGFRHPGGTAAADIEVFMTAGFAGDAHPAP